MDEGPHGHELVRDVMHTTDARLRSGATFGEAARALSATAASDLMIVEEDGRFVGVLSEGDLLRAVMPRFDELVRDGGSLQAAFRAFHVNGADLHDQSIGRLVLTDVITLAPDDELLSAATVMVTRQIRRLPVVADHELVGVVSRADVCRAVLDAV